MEQVAEATAGINLARTSYLPRADFLGQVNRATRNNIFGMVLPQLGPVMPSISGPPLPENDMTSVWGTAAAIAVSWEPFDFGLRRANVEAAESSRRRAEAGVSRTRFEVAMLRPIPFSPFWPRTRPCAAPMPASSAPASFTSVVNALVRSEFRPGVDAARFRAELAAAENQLIQAERAARTARASLSQFLGTPAEKFELVAGKRLDLPAAIKLPDESLGDHPFAREQSAAVDEAMARRKALDREYFPRFNVVGSAYGRGAGAEADFTTRGGLVGLGPNIFNWGVGMNVYFPALERPGLRARREIELHRAGAESARYDKMLQDLTAQRERAMAALEAAQRIARNTPVQLESARAAEQQATVRYKSGLGTVLEVAESQRLLKQAEIDDALARLNVWRAMLGVAAAQGDLEDFLVRTR